MTKITDAMLKEWEGLCKKATPGDWHVELSRDGRPYIHADDQTILAKTYRAAIERTIPGENNAAFIAAARTALPLLLAEIRRLRHGE